MSPLRAWFVAWVDGRASVELAACVSPDDQARAQRRWSDLVEGYGRLENETNPETEAAAISAVHLWCSRCDLMSEWLGMSVTELLDLLKQAKNAQDRTLSLAA